MNEQNDTNANKPLGQIGYEASCEALDRYHNVPWFNVSERTKSQAALFASAVEAAILSRQSPPVVGGELAEEELERLARIAYKAWDDSPIGADAFIPVVRVLLASRQPSPVYYKTAERPPEEKDAVRGYVHAWIEEGGNRSRYQDVDWWAPRDWPDLYPRWRASEPKPPAPVPPVSAEQKAKDEAIKEWMRNSGGAGGIGAENAFYDAWSAALAFAATQKEKGQS